MNTAPVRDAIPDVSSSAAEPVTSVEHMDDDNDDDVLCAAKDETSVDIMGRMFCGNFLRKSRL
jgi:hypothetical protein